MTNSRVRYVQNREKKKFKIDVNIKSFILPCIFLILIGIGIYIYISFRDIKTEDPLKKSGSHNYLMIQNSNSFRKSLIVFEKEDSNGDRIEYLYIFAYNEEKGRSMLLYVPTWLYYGGLEAEFGNSIPISSFKRAGEVLQQGRGVEYAIWQMEQLLGINIDEYIWIAPSVTKLVEGDDVVEGDLTYTQYYENGDKISQESLYLNSFISRLSWIRLILFSKDFREQEAVIYSSESSLVGSVIKLKEVQSKILSTTPYLFDLSKSSNISQKQSPTSGGMVNYLNTTGFDSTWKNLISDLIDKEVEQEMVRVEIYNGSGIEGAAGQFARKIENAGCDVVRYDNSPNKIPNSEFYVPNPDKYENSLKIVEQLFPGKYNSIQGRPAFMTTGDIVIILGEDISSMYSF